MYLSSHRLGDHPGQLLTLLQAGGTVAVIANALDGGPPEIRTHGVQDELAALGQFGLTAEELDLRDYFADRPPLADTLASYQLVWLRGGNVFVLRAALAPDHLLVELLRHDALAWAGYSAGCCVLAPSLRGLDLMVDPGAVQACYGVEPTWEGLAVLTYAIVPHYRSQHPQSEAAERLVARYRAEGVAHQALRDGEAIVIDARGSALLSD